ncbi:hypothetical protein Stube_66580 [Streptomyces tubercidicus]|uniref:Uncharacterized protein n=1 Tax=Streptomyces tubercidicus TaxID=47759 RepID=A0A640V517_9ACTN|nr:hypothetical protein Stube_66580 [Streptomyces tubercidicus]
MAERSGRVDKVMDGVRNGPLGGQPHREQAGALPSDGHREMVLDDVSVPGLLVGLPAAERPALGAVSDGDRCGGRPRRAEGSERRTSVVREQQLHGEGSVALGEHRTKRVHQSVRGRRPQRSFYLTALHHGLSGILRPWTRAKAGADGDRVAGRNGGVGCVPLR